MEVTIQLPPGPRRVSVTGPSERNLKLLREALGVRITGRDQSIKLSGESDAVGRAARVFERLTSVAKRGEAMSRDELLEAIAETGGGRGFVPEARGGGGEGEASGRSGGGGGGGAGAGPSSPPLGDDLDVYLTGKKVKPATDGQRRYLRSILDHDLTLCCGPAGTGKTYLAVAAAVAMLRRGMVRKLVLVRPAVEAGEKLGFLPGTMQEKVNPYLRPLLDALHDMMEFEQIQRFMACDLIEIVPLAFMRGRTLNDAVVILDEAQNTTRSQMLMFLTRLGHGSKMVVTGDTSQIDLDDPRDSGLVDAVRRLQRVGGVASVALEGADIVRHNLVQRIITAYGGEDATRNLAASPAAESDAAGEEKSAPRGGSRSPGEPTG